MFCSLRYIQRKEGLSERTKSKPGKMLNKNLRTRSNSSRHTVVLPSRLVFIANLSFLSTSCQTQVLFFNFRPCAKQRALISSYVIQILKGKM